MSKAKLPNCDSSGICNTTWSSSMPSARRVEAGDMSLRVLAISLLAAHHTFVSCIYKIFAGRVEEERCDGRTDFTHPHVCVSGPTLQPRAALHLPDCGWILLAYSPVKSHGCFRGPFETAVHLSPPAVLHCTCISAMSPPHHNRGYGTRFCCCCSSRWKGAVVAGPVPCVPSDITAPFSAFAFADCIYAALNIWLLCRNPRFMCIYIIDHHRSRHPGPLLPVREVCSVKISFLCGLRLSCVLIRNHIRPSLLLFRTDCVLSRGSL